MKRTLLPTVVACLLAGCTSTYYASSPEEVARRTISRTSVITNSENMELHAQIVRVTADTLFYVTDGSTIQQAVALSIVRRITTTSHSLGALEGFGLGFAGGAGIGYVFAAVLSHGRSGDAAMGLIAFPIFGAGLGIFFGTTIGAVNGHQYVTIPPRDSTALRPFDRY